MIRATAIVEGIVQGVGYRYLVRRVAIMKNLVGEVENLKDGRVKIVVEGEEDTINDFFDRIKLDSPPIKVANIEVAYDKATGEFKTFTIKTGKLEEEIVEGFSTGSAYLDLILKRQDEMLKKQDDMLKKQDDMLKKQDETLSEIKGLRNDVKMVLDERISRIEKDIEEIKARLGM